MRDTKDLECRMLPVRCDKQAILDDCKRSRTFMTTSGMKTFPVQPMINNSTIAKYQTGKDYHQSRAHSPIAHSTPKPPSRTQSPSLVKLPNAENTTSLKLAENKHHVSQSSTHSLGSRSSTSRCRPGSSHSTTYNIRSSSCTPSNLYLNDALRHAASNISRSSSGRTHKTTDTPIRFGKPITLPGFVKNNPHLKHKELSLGQKQYLWGIARIYSVHKLKKLKQSQYQALLDHEFQQLLEKKSLNEREKIKEAKEYLRYTKFIKTYEQRIPRHLRSASSTKDESLPSHIHKHSIKGWTTKDRDCAERRRHTALSSDNSVGDLESEEYGETKKKERGLHIYKHTIKGWTMDPSANKVFRQTEYKETPNEENNESLALDELQKALDEEKLIYRVDITRSDSHDDETGDRVTITKLSSAENETSENGGQQISVLLRDLVPEEPNYL